MYFNTSIRNGTVVTASERFEADIGIRDGRIWRSAATSREPIKRSMPAVSSCSRAASMPTVTSKSPLIWAPSSRMTSIRQRGPPRAAGPPRSCPS